MNFADPAAATQSDAQLRAAERQRWRALGLDASVGGAHVALAVAALVATRSIAFWVAVPMNHRSASMRTTT